jgi:hypothetical protein
MITLYWAAKGGAGTTVAAATAALTATRSTLLVDLAGDLPAALGMTAPAGPGSDEWLASTAEPERLLDLATPVRGSVAMVHGSIRGNADAIPVDRWEQFVAALRRWETREEGDVIVDAGTGEPVGALVTGVDRAYLVTRACYLALRRALEQTCRPSGVVVVCEPRRALGASDIERTLGAPIVTRIELDPAVARAVDAGLLAARLPSGLRREVRAMAA